MSGTVLDSNTYKTSTSGQLSANQVWEGAAQDVRAFSKLVVYISSSHDSAVGGLQFQHSTDAANWDYEETATYLATDAQVYTLPVLARYFRVRYTNGGTDTTSFALQCIGQTGTEAARPRGEVFVLQSITTFTSAGTSTLSTRFLGGERCSEGRLNIWWDVSSVGGAVGDTLDCLVDFSFDGTFWGNAGKFNQVGLQATRQVMIIDPTHAVTVTSSVSTDATVTRVRTEVSGPYIRARFTASESSDLVHVSSLKAYLF